MFSGIVNNETLGYFMARTQLWLEKVGEYVFEKLEAFAGDNSPQRLISSDWGGSQENAVSSAFANRNGPLRCG